MNERKREYYIEDKRILPNLFKSVIKVNDLVQHSKIKYETIKKVGISRSTYYKYKDFNKPFESGKIKYSVSICRLRINQNSCKGFRNS